MMSSNVNDKRRATMSKSLKKLITKEVLLQELDVDFLEYDLYDIPYFKTVFVGAAEAQTRSSEAKSD